jgi:hypothetical protein
MVGGAGPSLQEISTLFPTAVEQARNSAAQFHERRDRRSRQRNHLVVPSADSFDKVEHLSEPKLHDRIHVLVVPTHLNALAQGGRCRIEFASLAACRDPGHKRPKVRFGLVESTTIAQYGNRPDKIPGLQFPQGIGHVGACYPKRVGDILRGERLLRCVQQRMDLAYRSVYTPALTEVSPLQNKLPDRIRNAVFNICCFCHDRYYRILEMNCQAGSGLRRERRSGVPAGVYNPRLKEVFMTTYLRAASAIAPVILCVACAATTADVKPKAAASALGQNPACLTEAGSRIAANSANCSAIGRSYSRDDIDRTGATTAGEALRLMDPSVTVHH